MSSSINPLQPPLPAVAKYCTQCHVAKPLGEFSRSSEGRDGRRAYCKSCQGAYLRAWRAAHPRCSSEVELPEAKVLQSCMDTHVATGDAHSCWPWHGHVNDAGYGVLDICVAGRRSRLRAHRAAFLLAYGYLPDAPLQVRHAVCGNRLCCNPAHLAVGTMKDNAQDAVRMDRYRHPWRAGRRAHTLRADDVRAIRSLRAAGVAPGELARRFKVGAEQIRRIVKREAWAGVD